VKFANGQFNGVIHCTSCLEQYTMFLLDLHRAAPGVEAFDLGYLGTGGKAPLYKRSSHSLSFRQASNGGDHGKKCHLRPQMSEARSDAVSDAQRCSSAARRRRVGRNCGRAPSMVANLSGESPLWDCRRGLLMRARITTSRRKEQGREVLFGGSRSARGARRDAARWISSEFVTVPMWAV
jgi:hypothetical protein